MKKIIPRQIVVDISSMCNLKCSYCPSGMESAVNYIKGFMKKELYFSIVDRIIKEKMDSSLTCCLLGESLLHPFIYEMMEYTVKKNVPFYLTTNTTIWDTRLFKLLVKNNSCYQLILSNNGLWDKKSKSIEACMEGIDRNNSKRNIERIIELKEKEKDSNLEIGIKIIRRGQDYEEIENLIVYWLKNGADFVIVGRPLISQKKNMRIYPCRHFKDMAMYIRSDGTVIPCGWHEEVVNRKILNFTKLNKTQSLIKFYNNDMFNLLRKCHNEGTFHYPCNECTIAYTGDGIEGVVKFRNKLLPQEIIYYHTDYSNEFYSYKEVRSRVSYLRSFYE